MAETLSLSAHQRLHVRRHTAEVLEVEAEWDPHGSMPPAHFHPGQAEFFEILAGVVTARVDGVEHRLGPGDTLDVPAGAVHQMCNAGGEPARARWETRPAGRTLEWWRAVDGKPSPVAMARLLVRYRDVFRPGVLKKVRR